MEVMLKEIGDFAVELTCMDQPSAFGVRRMFGERPSPAAPVESGVFRLRIRHGGEPNLQGKDTAVGRDGRGRWTFERPDYRLAISADYRTAEIQFYDYIGLRSVLMNWYSSVAAHTNWGLVVHSSCVIHEGEAYLFAGYSGTGKSTIASLSCPRPILSDEASLVKLTPGQPPMVYDSPLRSGLLQPAPVKQVPLRAVYLLEQSPDIRAWRIPGSLAFMALLDKIWYWPHQPEHSVQVVRMCKTLAEQVPVYGLEFQKNDLFWEAIS